MKELDAIRQSEDMKRLVSLTSEVEALKWKVTAQVEDACAVYGKPGELLTDWEKRLDAVERLVEHEDVQAVWDDGKTQTATNPLGFLQFEVRRVRRAIEQHREMGLSRCPRKS